MQQDGPVAPAAAPQKDRLAFLDVARGAATLLVLVEHAAGPLVPGYAEWSQANGSLGLAGVVLFLLISGFIIPVSLEKSGSNGRFWVRRVFRLFPAYWLSIAAAVAYLALGGPQKLKVNLSDPGPWLVNLTMLQGFFKVPHVWGVFWTLQLELVIYAACSALFVARLLNRWTTILLVCFAGHLIIGLAQPLLMGKPFTISSHKFLYYTPVIGVIAQRYVAGAFSARKAYGLLAGHVLVVVAIWAVNNQMYPDRVPTRRLTEFALVWCSAYLMLFTLVELRRFSMPAVLCWFGRISYSVYLMHPVVLVVTDDQKWPAWAFLSTFLAVTLLLSDLSFRFVETPGIALGRWVENKLFGAKPRHNVEPGGKAAI